MNKFAKNKPRKISSHGRKENIETTVFDGSQPVRLNKYIAMCGIASRRKADWLILNGSVRVNGKTITEVGTQVIPNTDQIFVKNKPIKSAQDYVYLMFNKPPKVVTTMNDPEGRPSIKDYFEGAKIRVFPVGRLDWDSEGLLLVTNDGAFAQKVAHPKSNVAKTYLVKLDGQPTEAHLQKLLKGVSIIGGKTRALLVQRMDNRGSDKYDWVKVIINEGRNRQIRHMFDKLGFDVKKLQRVAIGSLKLSNLDKGKFKILTKEEIDKIFVQPKELRDTRRSLHERVK
jgi:23S rRNA pseudouridine2605 synthase